MPDCLDLSALKDDPLYRSLWDAVLERCGELARDAPRGASRSAALIGDGGRTVSAITGLGQLDGTECRYRVVASKTPGEAESRNHSERVGTNWQLAASHRDRVTV